MQHWGITLSGLHTQTKVGKLVLANSSWCVWTAQKQSANTFANCWRQIELVSILANFFTNFFVLVNSYLTCERLANNCQPIKTRALFTWFICVTLHKMADASQDELGATSKFMEEVHNCPAVWDVLSVVYKDSKNKRKKMEELADKLSFVLTFLAFCVFSSLLLFHCSTWVPLH